MTFGALRLPFSLEPLMGEARLRARRRRLIVFAALLLTGTTSAALVSVLRPSGGPSSPVTSSGGSAAHGRPNTPGVARVRTVFAQHGLRPTVVFDTGTANAAEIDRIAPLRRRDRAGRLAANLARRELRLALARGLAHPLTWLVYPSVGTQIVVWGKLDDAKADARRQKRVLAKALATERAASVGHRVIGGPPGVERIANAVIVTSRFAGGEPQRLKAALAQLAKVR